MEIETYTADVFEKHRARRVMVLARAAPKVTARARFSPNWFNVAMVALTLAAAFIAGVAMAGV